MTGKARPTLQQCNISGKKCGLLVFGASKSKLDRCSISECGQQACKAMDSGSVHMTRYSLRHVKLVLAILPFCFAFMVCVLQCVCTSSQLIHVADWVSLTPTQACSGVYDKTFILSSVLTGAYLESMGRNALWGWTQAR